MAATYLCVPCAASLKRRHLNSTRMFAASGLIAINLDEGDELKWIRMTTGDNEVLISTSQGQAIRFHESDARPMGRVSRGVRGIRLRSG